MLKRHQPFAGIPAFYTDPGTGRLLIDDRGQALTDRDVDRFWHQAEPELDRLTLEMCAYHRARGEALEAWQLEAEAGALGRVGAVAFIAFCESQLASGRKLDPEYRERYGRALLIQEGAA